MIKDDWVIFGRYIDIFKELGAVIIMRYYWCLESKVFSN